MTYNEAKEKMMNGDWITVSEIITKQGKFISPGYASLISTRPNSKNYDLVMTTLIKVIETRKRMINTPQLN